MPHLERDNQKNSRCDGEILLPFENGELARVTLSLYAAPRGQHRPMDAYVVTECEGVFTGSARRAAETVFNLVGGRIENRGPVVAGFDAQGACPGLTPATGESGGLAFALALAGRLLNQNPGFLAATGVLNSSAGNGPIGRVNAVAGKIAAAIEHLPEKGRIFYPVGNHGEIPEPLAEKARQKQQALCPVGSVAEAIGIVYPERTSSRTPFRIPLKPLLLILSLLAFLFVITAGYLTYNDPGVSDAGSTQDAAFEIEKQTLPDEITTPDDGDLNTSSPIQPANDKGFD